MEAVQRQFIDWVATYNMERRGSVLKMAISVPQALEPAQPMTGYILGENANKALAPTGRGLGEGDLCEGGDSHPPKEFHAKPPAYCIQNAIHLRQNQTDVEKKLWHVLKDRRLAGYKFRRQHPIPPYIADFVCIEKKLIVELDGGQHAENAVYDAQRDAALEAQGFFVLRFWNNEILENQEGVLSRVVEYLEKSSLDVSPSDAPPLTPTLSPWGRGS
jgi:very-short-patch-repair endonuclease